MSATFVIVYWRDIPAQVRVRAGRERISRPLAQRFQEAIDAAAMRASVTSTDDYLEEWRTSPPEEADGDPHQLADSVAAELEAAYPQERLMRLAANKGIEHTQPPSPVSRSGEAA